MAPEWSPYGMLQAGNLDKGSVRLKTSHFAGHAYSGGFDSCRIVNPRKLMDKLAVKVNIKIRTDGITAVGSTGLKHTLVCIRPIYFMSDSHWCKTKGETNSYVSK